MLTPDMKRIIEEQRLGFVATASLDGTPNVSPKGTFAVLDDQTIAFGEIRSPGTIRNLKANPRIEVNFVDAFVRKGYRFAGMATVVERGEPAFDTLLPKSTQCARTPHPRDCDDRRDQGVPPNITGL